jgi:hypothetical protein
LCSAANKAAGGEFRELVRTHFNEFARRAPIKLLFAPAKFGEPIMVAVTAVRPREAPALSAARELAVRRWQCEAPDVAAQQWQITDLNAGSNRTTAVPPR